MDWPTSSECHRLLRTDQSKHMKLPNRTKSRTRFLLHMEASTWPNAGSSSTPPATRTPFMGPCTRCSSCRGSDGLRQPLQKHCEKQPTSWTKLEQRGDRLVLYNKKQLSLTAARGNGMAARVHWAPAHSCIPLHLPDLKGKDALHQTDGASSSSTFTMSKAQRRLNTHTLPESPRRLGQLTIPRLGLQSRGRPLPSILAALFCVFCLLSYFVGPVEPCPF